jgi:dolichol-phosphate mannosyltransferase
MPAWRFSVTSCDFGIVGVMTDAWIVIPTYNEVENLRPLVAAVQAALRSGVPELHSTILIVDDGSPDGTGELADRIAGRHSDVCVLHRPAKAGLGTAYVAGFRRALEAGADLVVEMDADLSHDPADLPRLLHTALDGADVVLGSRYVPGGDTPDWPTRRRLLSRAGCTYARVVLGLSLRDLTGGFRCFHASALRRIDIDALHADGYAFQIETAHRAVHAGCSVTEIPICFRERRHGASKLSAGVVAEAVWRVPALRLSHASPAPGPAAAGLGLHSG